MDVSDMCTVTSLQPGCVRYVPETRSLMAVAPGQSQNHPDRYCLTVTVQVKKWRWRRHGQADANRAVGAAFQGLRSGAGGTQSQQLRRTMPAGRRSQPVQHPRYSENINVEAVLCRRAALPVTTARRAADTVMPDASRSSMRRSLVEEA